MTDSVVLATLAWDRGSLDVWACSGAIHDLDFILDDGRRFAPLAEAPWRGTIDNPTIARHLANLGGEWPCVPFGSTNVDPAHHGYGTDNDWAVLARDDTYLRIGIEYPASHPVQSLCRTIAVVPGAASVRLSLEITVRRPCMLPIGIHPIFRLTPDTVLEPAAFLVGQVFPETFERRVSRLVPSARFGEDGVVPTLGGPPTSVFAHLAGLSEELVQLVNCDGMCAVRHLAAGVRTTLTWSRSHFPNVLVWVSNHGRQGVPWGGTFAGIGIEPVNSHFDRVLTGENSVEMGASLTPDLPFVTDYEITSRAE